MADLRGCVDGNALCYPGLQCLPPNVFRHQDASLVSIVLVALVWLVFLPIVYLQHRGFKKLTVRLDRQGDRVVINDRVACSLKAVSSVGVRKTVARNDSVMLSGRLEFWRLCLDTSEGDDVQIDLGEGEYEAAKRLDLITADFLGVEVIFSLESSVPVAPDASSSLRGSACG